MVRDAAPGGSRWRVPAALGDAPLEGLVAPAMVRQGLFATAAAAAVFGLLYQLAGASDLVWPNAWAALALAALALLNAIPPKVRVYLGLGVGLAMLGEQLAIVATIVSSITPWFLVPNVVAMLAGMRKLAAACMALTIGELMLIGLGSELTWWGARYPVPYENVLMAASMVGTLLLCASFAWIVLRVRLRLTAELEDGHRELEAALDEARRARAEAVEAAEAKDRFFANLTHEIRTPLNGIAGTTELLVDTPLDDEQRELAGQLAASTAALVALVNSMLDHARLRAGDARLDLAPMEVRRAFDDIRASFAAPVAAKGLVLAVAVRDDVPAWISTDRVRLRQVVDNLLGNAVKFTERGRVAVDVMNAARPDGKAALMIRVSDTGPGIPPEQQAAIFEPFVQGDASITRAHGGTGLGLAIARQLATLLGGTLTLDSRVGAGSTFTFAFPVRVVPAPPAPPPRPQPAPAPPDRPRVRVLLAEDNPVNRAVSERMLEVLGADVAVAEDGLEAVDLATSRPFDLVLMDLQMPRLDGIRAAEAIRSAETLVHSAALGLEGEPSVARRVRILAMTGNAPEDYGTACAEAGMDGFLTKPVTLDTLREALERATPAAPTAG